MRKIIVVGGGASGMFAAYFAAKQGNSVILFEKNENHLHSSRIELTSNRNKEKFITSHL